MLRSSASRIGANANAVCLRCFCSTGLVSSSRQQSLVDDRSLLKQKLRDCSKDEPALEEGDLASFYDMLKSPIETNIVRGSTPSRLDPEYIKGLHMRLAKNTSSKLDADATSLVEKRDQELRNDFSIESFIKVIHLYAQLKSPERALDAFQQAMAVGLKIDVPIINALMDSYAEVGNLDPAVNADDLRAAFQIYETMKEKKVNPNLPIFTTLIKGCVQAKDVSRAWKTFDYMRGEICEPDTTAYSLMIHACATTHDCERALDLFEEMASKACGSRADYYLEAWDLFEQMKAQGFAPTKRTYNVLLWIAARNGDLKRCTMIWDALNEQVVLDPDFKPDSFAFMGMFHGLSKAADHWRRTPSKTRKTLAKEEKGTTSDAVEGKTALDAIEVEDSVSPPCSDNASLLAKETDDEVSELESSTQGSYLSSDIWEEPTGRDSGLISRYACHRKVHYEFRQKALVILRSHLESNKDLTPRMKSEVMDYYLSVYCSLPKNAVAASRALTVFKSDYNKLGIAKTGRTYGMMLSLTSKDKDLMKVQGQVVWDEFLAWDLEQEELLRKEKGFLTKDEVELERQKQHRGKDVMFLNFVRRTKGLTRIDDINQALDTIDASAKFREPFYLPPIHFNHINILVDRVRDLAMNGHLEYAKRLRILCDPPSDNAVEEVKRVLKKQWIASDWWGWEALGIEEGKRKKMLRDRKKENARVKQYFAERRSKR
ncbi:hypothetical protein BC829DRAFT_445257 [Chytridium lagenaria]|nr:hypothetical protein BC829DRAFT_445257 [Chytridium lagenaria]